MGTARWRVNPIARYDMSKQATSRRSDSKHGAPGFRRRTLCPGATGGEGDTQGAGHREGTRRHSGVGEQESRPLSRAKGHARVWSQASKSSDSLLEMRMTAFRQHGLLD